MQQEIPVYYIHLRPNDPLPPALTLIAPNKVVVLAEHAVETAWQNALCDWLVSSGCRYAMAWGVDATVWDDAFDWADLDYQGLDTWDESKMVMTTWHDDEPMNEVFWFCHKGALHSNFEFLAAYIVHIADEPRETEILRCYHEAKSLYEE